MAEANSGLGTFSIHSDRFNSAPGVEPVTETRAFSGGEVFNSVSTSPRAKANGYAVIGGEFEGCTKSLFYRGAEARFQGLAALRILGDDGSQMRDALIEGRVRAEQLAEGALVLGLGLDLRQCA